MLILNIRIPSLDITNHNAIINFHNLYKNQQFSRNEINCPFAKKAKRIEEIAGHINSSCLQLAGNQVCMYTYDLNQRPKTLRESKEKGGDDDGLGMLESRYNCSRPRSAADCRLARALVLSRTNSFHYSVHSLN